MDTLTKLLVAAEVVAVVHSITGAGAVLHTSRQRR